MSQPDHYKTVNDAITTMREAVLAQWKQIEADADKRQRRVHAVAKALFGTGRNAGGYPPDTLVMAAEAPTAGKGLVVTGPFVPAWATYTREAEAIVTALEALEAMEF